jgi:hypothetical protein
MASSDISFARTGNVPHAFGRHMVYVYPEVAPDISDPEKSYVFVAFQVNPLGQTFFVVLHSSLNLTTSPLAKHEVHLTQK